MVICRRFWDQLLFSVADYITDFNSTLAASLPSAWLYKVSSILGLGEIASCAVHTVVFAEPLMRYSLHVEARIAQSVVFLAHCPT